jgi:hypothetical protein
MAASVSLLTWSSFAASSGPPLSPAQFKAAIVGQQLKWESKDTSFSLSADDVYNADGSVTGTWKAGSEGGDIAPASWFMRGNTVCVKQSPKNGGKTACHTWHKVDDANYTEMNANGSLHGTDAIVK